MHPAQLGMFESQRPGWRVSTPFRNGQIIYEAKGRAREYRELACNLYRGCDHRCVYCYAPGAIHSPREAFGKPEPRPGIIAKLEAECRTYAESGDQRQVLFSFTSDPYQRLDIREQLTRQALQLCRHYNVPFSVLTKGGSRAIRDADLFTPQDAFASTLTFLDKGNSSEWEPGAAAPEDRIDTLRYFHQRGIPTWVSLEPVIDPDITMQIVRETHTFVDEYKVGTLNYHERARQTDWPLFAWQVRDLLESLGCRYYLKEDLRAYLP